MLVSVARYSSKHTTHGLLHSSQQRAALLAILALTCLLDQSISVTAFATKSLSSSRRQRKQPRRPNLPKDCFSFRNAVEHNIVIKKTKAKGLGAFLGKATGGSSNAKDTNKVVIQAGERIGEYTGEFLTRYQVETRYWKKASSSATTENSEEQDRQWADSRRRRHQGMSGDYLFDMGDDLFLDAEDTDVGSWCRFMNHASETQSLTTKAMESLGGTKVSDNDDGNEELQQNNPQSMLKLSVLA